MAVIDSAALLLRGTQYSGSGDWLDESGNNYDGVITAATFDATRKAFLFNSSTDKIVVTSNATLDLSTSETMTMIIVAEFVGISGFQCLVGKQQQTGSWAPGYSIALNGGAGYAYAYVTDGTNSATLADLGSGVLAVDTQYQIASRIDLATEDLIRGYWDGTEKYSGVSTSAIGSPSNAYNFVIGQTADATDPFNGYIYAVALWTSVLSAADIATAGDELVAAASGGLTDTALVDADTLYVDSIYATTVFISDPALVDSDTLYVDHLGGLLAFINDLVLVDGDTLYVDSITGASPPSPPAPPTLGTIEDILRAGSLGVTVGLDLLDQDGSYLADISGDFISGSISHNNLATIHGKAQFKIAGEYTWESVRLRPSLTVTNLDTAETQTWNMGVWIPNTPERSGNTAPPVFNIEAYDKLVLLSTPYGASYALTTSDTYLGAVEAILAALGESYSFDQTKAATTLISDIAWEIDEKNTYLRIINDLLGAVGYRGLYVDRNGVFRSEPYISPAVQPTIFDYSTTNLETVMLDNYRETSDYFDIPNKWVFINDNPSQTLPVEGTGIYTVTNQSDGPSSIDARGRIIARIVKLEAADQTSLETIGDRIVGADKEPITELEFSSSPNPDHWHATVFTVEAPEVGIGAGTRFAEAEWTLPLGPFPMSHKAKKVAA